MEQLKNPLLVKIFEKIKDLGFIAYFVGGCVRDSILDLKVKDFDVEVFGCSIEELKEILSAFGSMDLIGSSFGIIQLRLEDLKVDFSVPRKENRIGVKHQDFEVSFDKNMSIEEAAERRDFTINAIYYDPIKDLIIDPFKGAEHIKKLQLIHVSDKFKEDPLRILRGLKFSARFGFKLHSTTGDMMISIIDELKHLPKERIRGEFEDIIMKGKSFSYFFDYLKSSGFTNLFPELDLFYQFSYNGFLGYQIIEFLIQSVMNEAKEISDKTIRTYYFFSALFYYMEITFETTCNRLEIKNPFIDEIFIKKLMTWIGYSDDIIDEVVLINYNIVRYFRTYEYLTKSIPFVRTFARIIFPLTIKDYEPLMAGILSVNQFIDKTEREEISFITLAKTDGVYQGPAKPFITGDILKSYGMVEGKELGDILRELQKKQDIGEINNYEEAIEALMKIAPQIGHSNPASHELDSEYTGQ